MIRGQWQYFRNEDCASLHLDRELPEMDSTQLEQPTPGAARMVRMLMLIPGVVEASSATRYELNIEKGHVFAWSEVRPQIEKSVEEWFQDDLQVLDDAEEK